MYRATVLAIGVASEEFLYRGFGFARLEQAIGNKWIAGAIVSCLFAIAHIPLWGSALSSTTGFAFLAATGIYIWRRDIIAIIAAHLIADLIGLFDQ